MKNGQRAFLEQLGLERQSTHSALPRVIGHNRVNSTHWSMETSPSVPFPSQAKQSKSKDQVSFAFRSPLSSAWSLSPLRSMITGIRRRSLKRAITASNQLKASKESAPAQPEPSPSSLTPDLWSLIDPGSDLCPARHKQQAPFPAQSKATGGAESATRSMLTLSILPAHATCWLIKNLLGRPQAELSHVPNMRLLELDAPSFVPGHGSHLDSHLVDEGAVDSFFKEIKGAFSSTLLFYMDLEWSKA
ncbi:unnamed protein product [Ilex paraguariensis]|uniref:Uncharacterized protein n=1 Tax=Ilex paraguariensis TaxID=185542 RepID=A0ABC8S916_9AQUA